MEGREPRVPGRVYARSFLLKRDWKPCVRFGIPHGTDWCLIRAEWNLHPAGGRFPVKGRIISLTTPHEPSFLPTCAAIRAETLQRARPCTLILIRNLLQ